MWRSGCTETVHIMSVQCTEVVHLYVPKWSCRSGPHHVPNWSYPLEKSSYHSRSHIAVSEFEESTQIPYTQKRARCKADTSTNSAPLRRVLCNYRPYLFNAPETYLFRYEISELPRAITVKLRHVIGPSLKNLGQKTCKIWVDFHNS